MEVRVKKIIISRFVVSLILGTMFAILGYVGSFSEPTIFDFIRWIVAATIVFSVILIIPAIVIYYIKQNK